MVTFEASKLDFFSKDTPNKLIPGLSFDFFFACMLACLMCNTFLFFGRKGETKKEKKSKTCMEARLFSLNIDFEIVVNNDTNSWLFFLF